jgi:hypothetical protein
MKNILKSVLLLSTIMLLTASLNVGLAQTPPAPPSHDKGGNQGKNGGGAPIDGGLAISLAMVAGYGAYKWLKAVRKKKQSL